MFMLKAASKDATLKGGATKKLTKAFCICALIGLQPKCGTPLRQAALPLRWRSPRFARSRGFFGLRFRGET